MTIDVCCQWIPWRYAYDQQILIKTEEGHSSQKYMQEQERSGNRGCILVKVNLSTETEEQKVFELREAYAWENNHHNSHQSHSRNVSMTSFVYITSLKGLSYRTNFERAIKDLELFPRQVSHREDMRQRSRLWDSHIASTALSTPFHVSMEIKVYISDTGKTHGARIKQVIKNNADKNNAIVATVVEKRQLAVLSHREEHWTKKKQGEPNHWSRANVNMNLDTGTSTDPNGMYIFKFSTYL